MQCEKLIRGGFSFCGVDIADLGLNYAPEKENTYVYRPAETTIHEETFDGHDGGYFYGASKQIKEFILRCYFEEEAIDRGLMERIYNLFRMGKSGKLIFSRRPWCYYYATVTSSPAPELANYLNGTITITMKSYYPFARSDLLYSPADPNDGGDNTMHDLLMRSTALFDRQEFMTPLSYSNLTASTSLLLHNPGTERADVSIVAAGDVGAGITIRNKTTKQECRIVAMDKAHTSNYNKTVRIDGVSGKTSLIDEEGNVSPAYFYHESGFIQLAPAYPMLRELYIEAISNTTVQLYNRIYTDVIGSYIYIGGSWRKIVDQPTENTIVLDQHASKTSNYSTVITKMNEIEIIPDNSMDLTHLSFSYKPTFA